MSQRKYQSVQDIETDFERRIQNEDDPLAKADLRVELAQAKIDFRNEESQIKLVDTWRRLALVEYPAAGKFPELVTGNTEEQIMLSAKEAADRVNSLQTQAQGGGNAFDQVRDRAAELYGRGSGSGGIGGGTNTMTGGVSPDRGEERWAQQFAEHFNDAPRDAYGMRLGVNPRDVTRYTNHRFVTQIKDRIGFWGRLTRSDFR
jgi:hypothetical protein